LNTGNTRSTTIANKFPCNHTQTDWISSSAAMTRSHKLNDRDHVGLANGTALPEEHLPRYFAKSGFSANNDPNRVKKSGNGKGNWGRHGEELEDMDDFYRPSKPRRRSNASAQLLDAMTSKFEVVEAEPMFK
ncbi:hypothetical protein KCU64_g23324, partial [Aureobasidium melanogenum]